MRWPSENCVGKLGSCLCVRHKMSFKGGLSPFTRNTASNPGTFIEVKNLPRTQAVGFAIGMKVLVTENIEIDLDLTNGTRGEIVDIVLHPDEPPIGNTPVVHLKVHLTGKYMSTYIPVKLSRIRVRSQAINLRQHLIENFQ